MFIVIILSWNAITCFLESSMRSFFVIYGIRRTFQFWNSEEMLVIKLGLDVLLLMLRRLRFCKSFQSGNYVYYDFNNSALDFLI